jgi:sortase A
MMKIRMRGSVAAHVQRFVGRVSLFAFAAGFSLLCYAAFVLIDSELAQWAGMREIALAAGVSQGNATQGEIIVPESARPARRAVRPKPGSTIGKFEIQRLGMYFVVLEGTGKRTLDRSIGHIEDTALPGEGGNIGIAGHRNTHFKKLEWIRRGDQIVLTTSAGAFRYQVEWVRLFTPSDLYVLDPSHGPAVTLITCFPFEYVGSAPQRFVVRALPDTETRARLAQKANSGTGD